MEQVEHLTPAQYARRRGVSRPAVSKAIRRCGIPLTNGRLDPVVADHLWERRTDPVQSARALGQQRSSSPAKVADADQPAGEGRGQTDGYCDSKARRDRAEAQLAELELGERIGELVQKVGVARETFGVFRALRERILTVPDRIAPILAAESDGAKVHTLLAEELKSTLREVVQTLVDPDPA